MPLGKVNLETEFLPNMMTDLATRGPNVKTQEVHLLLNRWSNFYRTFTVDAFCKVTHNIPRVFDLTYFLQLFRSNCVKSADCTKWRHILCPLELLT